MNKLKKTITKQLESLEIKLEEIRNFSIESDDPNMWDSDYYYNLAEQLKEILTFLKAEQGLLENLNVWETIREENEDYDYEE